LLKLHLAHLEGIMIYTMLDCPKVRIVESHPNDLLGKKTQRKLVNHPYMSILPCSWRWMIDYWLK